MKLTSTAFENGNFIPSIYTCDGQNISPPLTWENPPANTQSFVLIVDDPDAPGGTWDHWLLFNIPANMQNLAEDFQVPNNDKIQAGSNSWNNNTYGGPCPPSKIHRYVFKLYALNTILNLTSGVNKFQIEAAMQSHILATAELIGKYTREK